MTDSQHSQPSNYEEWDKQSEEETLPTLIFDALNISLGIKYCAYSSKKHDVFKFF